VKEMSKDLSNKAIACLILVSLVITVIGTWLILEKFDTLNPVQTKESESASASGELSLEVTAKKVDKGKSSGDVVLNII
jgi:hypothetical protein